MVYAAVAKLLGKHDLMKSTSFQYVLACHTYISDQPDNFHHSLLLILDLWVSYGDHWRSIQPQVSARGAGRFLLVHLCSVFAQLLLVVFLRDFS